MIYTFFYKIYSIIYFIMSLVQSENSANSNNYFYIDGCYEQPQSVNFQNILTNNFYASQVSSVKDCEIQSLRNNTDFFLVNDISSTLNRITTTCYIPKMVNSNNSIFGSNSSISMSKQLFDSLNLTNKQTNYDICDNLLFNASRTEPNRKCFKYTLDDQIYTPGRFYAYYKKPVMNQDNINLLNKINSYEHYNSKLSDLRSYEDLLKDNGPLVLSFINYVTNPNSDNTYELDFQINQVNSKTTTLKTAINDISQDLSSISYLNSFDDETIRSLNLNIANKSRELKSLFGSGGANNGRLDDRTLLTQFKIVENSILLLLIVCVIFYFTKKNKVI
jgi:hypothetical protein